MDININLNQQGALRSRKKVYIIGAIVTLLLSITSIVAIILETNIFLVFHAIYFLGFAIVLYFNSKGKSALDLLGETYFRVDEIGFSCKLDLFSKKTISLSWNEIQDIKLKLFEVKVKTGDGWLSINLEKLSDDNLKLVKKAFEKNHKSISKYEQA